MANTGIPEFGPGRTIVVIAIVVGCFAVLWPKLLSPMLQTIMGGGPGGRHYEPGKFNNMSSAVHNVIFATTVHVICRFLISGSKANSTISISIIVCPY